MFLLAVSSLLLVSVDAGRVQIHKAKSQFDATCEDLQATFRNRVDSFQTVLDALPDDGSMSRRTQARLSMRSLGLARTMRRARECTWLADGDSEDVERMRGVVQAMLEGNPCAPSARAELDAGTSDSDESIQMEAVQRAMSVLISENCEVTLPAEADGPPKNMDDDDELEVQIGQAEEQAQGRVDELMHAAMDEDGSSFVETSSKRPSSGFFIALGVLMLFLFSLAACTAAGPVLTFFLIYVFTQMGLLAVTPVGFVVFVASISEVVTCPAQLFLSLVR